MKHKINLSLRPTAHLSLIYINANLCNTVIILISENPCKFRASLIVLSL